MKQLLLASTLLALVATACSDRITTSTEMVYDEQEPPPADQVTFTFIQENVFDSCALSGCHADLEYPNLSAGQAYANIVDALSSEGIDLVEPGDPDNSYLYVKIAGGPRLNGSLMPRGRTPLPAETIAAVREWIERGAPND